MHQARARFEARYSRFLAPTAGRQLAAAVVLVTLAAIVPYASTVDDYFLRDDFGTVELLAGKPATAFPSWFTSSWMDEIWGYVPDEIRPFPAVSYQLTALPGAGVPHGHHLLNIGFHAANSLLVFAIGVGVFGLGVASATFAAAAFALLPAQPESVAWITGRVDSMPAFLYLSTFFAYARWRQRATLARYLTALALFFMTLFSKQTAITMPATLLAYDLIVRRDRSVRLLAVVPFALMTAGYLALRYFLFGHAVRENQLGEDAVANFLRLAERHLARVVVGDVDGSRVLLVAALLLTAAMWVIATYSRTGSPRLSHVLLFAGPVWWTLGVAPVAVAGYESSRHVYLASVGWGLTLGCVHEVVRTFGGDLWRRTCLAAAMVVLVVYALALLPRVRDYNQLAVVSERAVRGVASEARVAREGSLVIVGVPPPSWEWAMPFAVRPPFAPADMTTRVFFIYPRALHCCSAQWFDDTRATLEQWTRGPASDSVLALRWSATGSDGRITSSDDHALPDIARSLLAIDRPEVLNTTIERLLNEVVPQRVP